MSPTSSVLGSIIRRKDMSMLHTPLRVSGFFGALAATFSLGLLALPLATTIPASAESAMTAASKAAHAAADQFDAMAKGSELSRPLPRQTDPAVARLLDVVFNIAPMPTGHAPPESEMDAIMDWQTSISRVGWHYIYAGTGVADPRAGFSPSTGPQTERNIVTFAPEVGRYFDATISMFIFTDNLLMQAPINHPEDRSDPKMLHGISLGAQGTANLLNSILSTMTLPGLTDEWRRARMGSLRAITPTADRMLSAEQKTSLNDTAMAVAGKLSDPELKNQLITFGLTMTLFLGPAKKN
jgi:hypothetical protein